MLREEQSYIFILMMVFTMRALSIEPAIFTRYELISALQRHFSSGCVVWQMMGERSHDHLLKRSQIIIRMQSFLSMTSVLSTVVDTGSLNTTLPCPRNRPLYVIWCSGNTKGHHLRQLFSDLYPSNARWLLLMHTGSIDIEELLGDVNIPFDCEFLVAVESQEAVDLSEVYRVHNTLPLVTSRWGRWSPASGLTAPSLGLIPRRNDLGGIDFIAAGTHDEPMEHLGKEDQFGNVEARGYPVDLWKELSIRLNFSLITRRSKDNLYGRQLPNGSWNGILGMVLEGKANASLALISITTARSNILDFTDTVFLLWTDVHIRTRYDSDNSWGMYFAPFTVPLWLSVAGCVVITTFFMGMMHHLQPEEDVYSFQEAFFAVAGGFCSQGFAVFPQHPSLRLAVWLSLFTGFVVLGSYGARITSSLAVKIPTLPFRDLEGLLRDDSYGFGMYGKTGFAQMFKFSPGVRKDLYDRKLLPNLNSLPMNHEEGFQRVCNQKYAYFCARIVVPETAPCDMTMLPQASSALYTAFVVRKRSPYRRIINYTLKRMMAAGVHRKLQLQWLAFPDDREPPPLKSVQLSDVRAPLFICVAGTLISVCVLLVEVLRRVRK